MYGNYQSDVHCRSKIPANSNSVAQELLDAKYDIQNIERQVAAASISIAIHVTVISQGRHYINALLQWKCRDAEWDYFKDKPSH